MLWEEHPMNMGREYYITGRDMREAKEFLSGNLDTPPSDELKNRLNRFMASDFDAWKEQDYPLWALFKHWGRYAPPRVIDKAWRGLKTCPQCREIHYYGECGDRR
jgi:hypothetical protein